VQTDLANWAKRKIKLKDEYRLDIGDINDDKSVTVWMHAPKGNSLIVNGVVDGGLKSQPGIKFNSCRNTLSEPEAHMPMDLIASFSWNGYDGEKHVGSASYAVIVDNNAEVSSKTVPGKICLMTYPHNGLEGDRKFVTLDSKGRLAVNKFDADATLDVEGYAKLKPLSEEPENAKTGTIAVADGQKWNPCNKNTNYPVYFDGSVWHSMI
jgi:hypothetical protein